MNLQIDIMRIISSARTWLEFLLSFGYESIREEMVVTAAFETWSFQKLSSATRMTSPASSPIDFKQTYSMGRLGLLDTQRHPPGHLWNYTGSSTILVSNIYISQDLLNCFNSFFFLILEVRGKKLNLSVEYVFGIRSHACSQSAQDGTDQRTEKPPDLPNPSF